MKLRAVSPRIMLGTLRVNEAMMWLVNEGSMCLKMTRDSFDPLSWAAITYSSSRKDMNLPRTTRASPVQPTKERMTTIPK